ncbi:MAG: hypothetical protein AAF687_05285 [Pseudomonadota bacterium]
MMVWVGIGMFLGFGALAVKNFINRSLFFGGVSAIGSILGALSLWVSLQTSANAMFSTYDASQAAQTKVTKPAVDSADHPVIGDYDPDA